MSLRSSGDADAASVLKDITTTSPTRATKYKKAYQLSGTPRPFEMLGDDALVDMVMAKLTKQSYKHIRMSLKQKNFPAYPSYEKVVEAKKRCYPNDITVTEVLTEVKLQSLLNHTCERILRVQSAVVDSLHSESLINFKMIVKWGCDGSSGQSEYKQKFSDESSSDKFTFLTSLVPLQILSFDNNSKKELVVWKNPRPSSPRFCRPLSVQFLQENVQTTITEEQYINDQIKSLVPFETVFNGRKIIVQFQLYFTMIDMKVCNSVTGTKSSMRCYLCNATSKDFNNIESCKKRDVDQSKLRFGLSTLHSWIRFFEFFLHIGYKLGTQKWQARKADDKKSIEEGKRVIQAAFKRDLHLNIDKPKPGFGNTNDGNTARRFFDNSYTSAKILGVDEDLMKRSHVILQVMSSGFAVNVDASGSYCFDTAEMIVQLYPWYCMPTTIHKVLIHGPAIIEWAPLPIGQMSEDAQEARNKDMRKYREHFSRKTSRTATMQDVFNRLLVTSDPFISSMRGNHPKINRSLCAEALNLLLRSVGSYSQLYGVNDSFDYSANESRDSDSD